MTDNLSLDRPSFHDSASSSSSNSSDQVSAFTQQQQSQSGSERKLQTKVVGKLKRLVSAVLALTALGFGAAVYALTRREERGDFEARFDDLAHEIISLAKLELETAFGAAINLATTITSHVVQAGSAWPEIVVPHFELQGISLTELARIQQFTIAPLVDVERVNSWQNFSVANQHWIQQGVNVHLGEDAPLVGEISSVVYRANGDAVVPQTGAGINGKYAPVWQQFPAPSDPTSVNFDLLSHTSFEAHFDYLARTKGAVLSEIVNLDFLFEDQSPDNGVNQQSFLLQPIFADFSKQQNLVGFLVGVISWDDMLGHLIQANEEQISIVLHDTCADRFWTYEMDDSETVLVGTVDFHEGEFDNIGVSSYLEGSIPGINDSAQCALRVIVYPTSDFRDQYMSFKPLLYAVLATLLFVFTTLVFGAYDFVVQKMQRDLLAKAERTNKLVSELFPRNVKERLLGEDEYTKGRYDLGGETETIALAIDSWNSRGKVNSRGSLQKQKSLDPKSPYETKPIADLFPNATILFGDLVGFTAWSSVREPTHVFILLETLFHNFDIIAKKRNVFKVETVGDCYVAASGLPEGRPDHALVMARFARDIKKKMNELVKQLQTTLGPDTADLSMRIGLHSGPVTAGVLRGEKSRFQLFGDTVNTAARIEASGERNKIHVSKETFELLKHAGKSHWLKARAETVTPKGKGELQTYWLESQDDRKEDDNPRDSTSTSSNHDSIPDDSSECNTEDEFEKLGLRDMGLDSNDFDERTQSLVRWAAEILLKLLKQIVARRIAGETPDSGDPVLWPKSGLTPLEEFQEIIHLPEFDSFVAKHEPDPETIEIDDEVVGQLHDFVRIIASMYRSNPFHNFEHASHVAMSVSKLMSRIVAPSELGLGLGESVHGTDKSQKKKIKSSLHDYTFGITSDPLTQFSCVLSALIHDVDHCGVPNTRLVEEKAYIARVYNNKSVAEQNSIDSAWDLLMDVNFRALRKTICVTEDEQKRFRHLVVNSVLATDICDKELKALRNARWDRAFSDCPSLTAATSERDQINRKATIVIEHLIQASDVAHTMQHWHIYRKWNERLYHELLLAYKKGRSDTDPSDSWYKGELGFFDFYIIPLAKKLKNCGVFGVSCDEYLDYALHNRQEWERKGQEIVASMIEKYRDGTGSDQKVQLDGIQDSDGAPLRSSLLSSETMHGETSNHLQTTMLELDPDAVSVDSSTASFAVSISKSYDGCKSVDGKSYTSGADTIYEEDEEEDSSGDDENSEDDSFYSSEEESSSHDSVVDNETAEVPKVAPSNESEAHDDHINMTITTDSSASLRGSKSKSLRGSASKPLRERSNEESGGQPEAAPKTRVAKAADWGQNSADSFACDFVEKQPDRNSAMDTASNEKQTSRKPTFPRNATGFNVNPQRVVKRVASLNKGQSETTCSVTQANSEDWEHDGADVDCYSGTDTMEHISLYCLQQRLNARLVGSIKNTRAYDKRNTHDDMSFF